MAEPSAALVQRAQAGDREAVSALVQSQQTYVYSIAMSLMHNPAEPAAIHHEAFIRLLPCPWAHRDARDVCGGPAGHPHPTLRGAPRCDGGRLLPPVACVGAVSAARAGLCM